MAHNPSVNDFIANFQGGGARPNLYDVTLTFPIGIASPNTSRKASFLCKAAALPSSSVSPVVVPYMGRSVKLAGDREFDDWNIVILNDTDFSVRNAFEIWIDSIGGAVSNLADVGFSNPSRYYANALVEQKTSEGATVKWYSMEGIFPTQLAEIPLGYDNNNTVEEFAVTLAVNYWVSNTTT